MFPDEKIMFEKRIKILNGISCNNEKGVSNVSNNHEYLGLYFGYNFYLVEKNGKTLLHIKGTTFSCCFSNKYVAIIFYNFEQQCFLLYDLEQKKTKWAKKISRKFENNCKYVHEIQFYNENEIIMLSYEAIQIINLDGELKTIHIFQNKKNQKNSCDQLIRLNNQIFIYREQKFDEYTIFRIISINNSKNLRTIYYDSDAEIIKVSQNLIFEFYKIYPYESNENDSFESDENDSVESHENDSIESNENDSFDSFGTEYFKLKYRGLFQGKIIRKNQIKSKCGKISRIFIINNNLYLFGDSYPNTIISLTTGNIQQVELSFHGYFPLKNQSDTQQLFCADIIHKQLKWKINRKLQTIYFKVEYLII